MATIHVSETEAALHFSALIARVRAGAEIVIDGSAPAVKLSLVEGPGRLLSELIASAEARGAQDTLDEDFSDDLNAVIAAQRQPLAAPVWD